MSLMTKVSRFMKSPQGSKLQRAAKDPKTQAKLKGMLGKKKGPRAH